MSKTPTVTVFAGPITVSADDLQVAWQVARQARQRQTKGNAAAQCVNIEWFEDRIQLVGYHDKLLLRSIAKAEESRPGDLFVDEEMPSHVTMMIDPGEMSVFLKKAASRPGRSVITLSEVRRSTPGQIDGHSWVEELRAERDDGSVLTIPTQGTDPENWRAMAPYDQLPSAGASSFLITSELMNRLGSCARVARWGHEYLGEKRPMRLNGSFQDRVIVKGWILPSHINAADTGAVEAASFLGGLQPMPIEDPETEDQMALPDDFEDQFQKD